MNHNLSYIYLYAQKDLTNLEKYDKRKEVHKRGDYTPTYARF